MSYHTWTVDGFGVCVDDIETTPEKLLRLAAVSQSVLDDVHDYLRGYFNGEYNEEDLTLDDFDELEGGYCEQGVTYILLHVIKEILNVVYADDYNGESYILYDPKYPWSIDEKEKNLTKEDVENIFKKYISILTDKHVRIDYYSVENGG